MLTLFSLIMADSWFCLELFLILWIVVLWMWWLVPPIVKFSLWVLVRLIFISPFLFLGYLSLVLALGNPLVFFIVLLVFFPVKQLFCFVLLSFAFVFYLFRLALTKIYRYTCRYFFYSSTINIVFDDLDFYFIEILRDWLYPNDDRYRLIYRRWVFWVTNDKYQETYEEYPIYAGYYITFLWGYVARHFVMVVYMGWFCGLRFFHRILMKYVGTTLGCTVVFFSLCLGVFSFKVLPGKIASILWIIYRFICRQLYYLTGNSITFEIVRTFNWNWMEWDVSSNVDEFEEPDYTLARSPSSGVVRFFYWLNNTQSLFRRSGISKLSLGARQHPWLRQLFALLGAVVLISFANLIIFCFIFINGFLWGLFYLQAHVFRLSAIELVSTSNLKHEVKLFFKTLTLWCYGVFMVFFGFLISLVHRKIYPYVIFIPAAVFYVFVHFCRVFFLLPLAFLFSMRLFFRALFKLRGLVLIVFLFLIFSKEYLSFFYFFSLGWFSDLMLSTMDNFALIQHQFYTLPFSTRLSRGRRGVSTHVYFLFWMRQFIDALFSYNYYLLENLQQLLRLRNFWKQVTLGWRPWLFFIRFMPFFGQTTLIKKIWFERIYLWVRTPALFWWCYSGYDRLFRLAWVFSVLAHGLIFLPYEVFQRWFYYVFWWIPKLYVFGVVVYTHLWTRFLDVIQVVSYTRLLLIVGSHAFAGFFNLLTSFITWIIKWLLRGFWFLIQNFLTVLLHFSWVNFLYAYFCLQELVGYWFYCFSCYRWLLGIMFSDIKHWTSIFGKLFSSWMHFYFVYGFFFNYLSYRWNNFYDWWIATPLRRFYLAFPSLYSLVCLVDYVAINGNPAVYHVALFLRVQKLLDSVCISLQIPRDVQRNAYVFIRRRVVNVKFLGWLLSLRRTPMYSLDRWLMPVFSYFKVLEAIRLTGETTFNFSGVLDLSLVRTYFPAVYYGFVWNSYGVYFFALVITLVLSKEFTALLFHPFSEKKDQNREYAWRRFREEHPRNLKWMFFNLNVAFQLEDRTKVHNDLPAKFFYYEQLLKNIINSSHGGALKKAMIKFYNSSFWVRRSSLLPSEENVFISPLFFDFYLKSRYVNFRTTMHKGDELFTFFSAYAFSLNPWIHVAWDAVDQEDYEAVIEEVTFHAPSRRQFISFHDKVRALQHSIDKSVFSSQLSAWTLLKEPFNMSIIRTSFHDELNPSSSSPYYTLSPDIYEFEDDEDMPYVPWPILVWFCAIPFLLFYKSFFFLSGFNWHYNRHSPAIMQSYMLYFNSVIGHIQLITYARKLIGDNYFLHKREGATRGHSHRYYYRSYIRDIIKRSFYSYKLPYRGVNSWMSIDKIWGLKTVSFKFQFLTCSLLEELRFLNVVLFLWVMAGMILIGKKKVRQKKTMPPLGYPIKFLHLINNYSIKSTLKRLYLWFWQ